MKATGITVGLKDVHLDTLRSHSALTLLSLSAEIYVYHCFVSLHFFVLFHIQTTALYRI